MANGPDPVRRFYGRRKGPALTQRRRHLIDTLLPKLAVTLDHGPLDPATLFPEAKRAYWLEIGFGKGEHLVWQANHHPDVGLIGCEPFLNGVAGALVSIDERPVTNVRIYPEDARDLIDALPDHSLDRIFLLHPDPWPKYRHRDRRFINPAQLDMVARVLKPGGEFRTATDDPTYREWTCVQMAQRDDFTWTASGPADWRTPPDDWIDTRYNKKAQQEGRSAVFFTYQRA